MKEWTEEDRAAFRKELAALYDRAANGETIQSGDIAPIADKVESLFLALKAAKGEGNVLRTGGVEWRSDG